MWEKVVSCGVEVGEKRQEARLCTLGRHDREWPWDLTPANTPVEHLSAAFESQERGDIIKLPEACFSSSLARAHLMVHRVKVLD